MQKIKSEYKMFIRPSWNSHKNALIDLQDPDARKDPRLNFERQWISFNFVIKIDLLNLSSPGWNIFIAIFAIMILQNSLGCICKVKLI